MTDATLPQARGITALAPDVLKAKIRRRKNAELRFQAYGLVAIAVAVAFLLFLFSTIVVNAASAFRITWMTFDVTLEEEVIDPFGQRNVTMVQSMADFNQLMVRGLAREITLEDEPVRLRTLLELERVSDEAKLEEVDRMLRAGEIVIPGVAGLTDGVSVADLMDADGLIDRARILPLDEFEPAFRNTVNGYLAGSLRSMLRERQVTLQQLAGLEIFTREEATALAEQIVAETVLDEVPPRFPQVLQQDLNREIIGLMRGWLYQDGITLADIRNEEVAAGVERYMLELIAGLISSTGRLQAQEMVIVPDPSGAEFSEGIPMMVLNEDAIGITDTFTILAHSNVDQFLKGEGGRGLPEERRLINDLQMLWIDRLIDGGKMEQRFNWGLFFDGDSRRPENAGLGVAVVGSAYMMLIVLCLTLPLGVATAVYLEEFAPKNRFTDLIEVNINNLAAVPSIVFGLLGLSIFINILHLPISAPVVGGMVLTLMTLPTVIIATRAALKAVPPSIREAALGIGASKMQAISHHVLPLAMPGILTGTIIGMAQALGETAPLILIGMVAFVADYPGSPLDPASALPVQVYNWSRMQERGFVELTSAAILVLLAFLIIMNTAAVLLRRRFERRW